MRLGWLSDIHLNFLDQSRLRGFLCDVASCGVDAWLVGGDIGEANSLLGFLRLLETAVPCKTYFTLGNHDFYKGSLVEVRARVRHLVGESERLVWLTTSDPQLFDDGVGVVGDDSWADARFGNAHGTPVELNDFCLIEELTGLTRAELVRTLNGLGDAAAGRLAPKLQRAAASCHRVIVLVHVPPFREAAWYRGQPSDENWVPWFSCRAVGEVILACARVHPEVRFLVLCGHTHSAGVYSPVHNVTVHTAEAEYGVPRVQRVFEVDALTPADAWLN